MVTLNWRTHKHITIFLANIWSFHVMHLFWTTLRLLSKFTHENFTETRSLNTTERIRQLSWMTEIWAAGCDGFCKQMLCWRQWKLSSALWTPDDLTSPTTTTTTHSSTAPLRSVVTTAATACQWVVICTHTTANFKLMVLQHNAMSASGWHLIKYCYCSI